MKRGVFFISFIALSSPLLAAPRTYSLSDEKAPRQVRFVSEAPLEVVEGVAERFSGHVTLDEEAPELVKEAQVRVEVNGMQTGHTLRDTHMKSSEWLGADQHPVIQFSFAGADAPAKKKKENVWFLNARGELSVKGVNRTIMVPLTLTKTRRKNKDEITIVGHFTVKLSDHGIRGPAGMRMIGARVSDVVRVDIKLTGAH